MAPEHASVFVELRERAFAAGFQSVEFLTSYYGPNREVRYGIRLSRNGWDHSFYGKNIDELFVSFEIHLDERGG